MTDSMGTEIFPRDLLESKDCPNIPMTRYEGGIDFVWIDNCRGKFKATPEAMKKSNWIKHVPIETGNPQGRKM